MAEITNRLFGIDPAALQQQQSAMDTANAYRFALLNPMQRAQFSIARGAAGLGRDITGLLGGDEQMQRATQIRQLAANVDFSDPDSIDEFARSVSPFAPEVAAEASKRASELRLTGAKTQAALREKVTPSFRTLTPAEARAMNLDPNNTYQVEAGTNKITQIGTSPAVVFKSPLVQGETELSKTLGKGIGDKLLTEIGAGESAAENLNKINETLNELKTGQAFTGAFADLQSNIAKAQAKFAADKKAGKRVSDTEYLDALLGSDVFPMISSLGIGARGLDTPAERDFLRQVMTGTINLERDTLIRLTETRKNIAERAVRKYNEKVERGELDQYFKLRGTEPRKLELPKQAAPARQAGQPPAGVDPRLWNAMTPAEKALWK